MTRFRDLQIGDTFDFIDDANPTHNSFYSRCTKIGDRSYQTPHDGQTYSVGSINAKIYHMQSIGNEMAKKAKRQLEAYRGETR